MTDRIHNLLDHWFGDIGKADLPTSERTSLWFGEDERGKVELATSFMSDYQAAMRGELDDWSATARGRLALILLNDQFPRILHRQSPAAFNCDAKALQLCQEGRVLEFDHELTLIERVFFYMPLVHAEDTQLQEQSLMLYQGLAALSMHETTQVYQLFLAYAYAHYRVIKEFGRFPQRNHILGRHSSDAELAFLKDT